MSASGLISLSNASKRYGSGATALSDITLNIEQSEMVIISGHSGAGKSTLLRLMCAVEFPSSGTVIVAGEATSQLNRRSAAILRRRFGLVFQDRKLLMDRTAFANVMLPLQICGFDPRDAARRVRAALDKVGLLGKEKAMPHSLSGGEQQRLCIARAIVHRPAALILDEPTAHLDPIHALELVEMIRSFHQVGATIVLATHDAALSDRLNARSLELRGGMLAGERPPAVESV